MTASDLLQLLPQVLLEGLLVGCVYAMIALGYTMVYGVLGMINFAHSEVFMIGAVAGVEAFRYAGANVENPYAMIFIALVRPSRMSQTRLISPMAPALMWARSP